MIIKTRLFLVGAAILMDCVAVHASSAVINEISPPWSGSVTTRQQGSTATSGIENWYRERQRRIGQVNSSQIRALQSQVKRGNAQAAYQLGLLYQGGRGVQRNENSARQLFAQAASAGHAHAQHALAMLYRNSGNSQLIQQSVQWQTKAAQQGLAEAQYGLGQLYANGQYVARNDQQARHWLQQAASRGNTLAKLALDDLAVRRPVQRAQAAATHVTRQPAQVSAQPTIPQASPLSAQKPASVQRPVQKPVPQAVALSEVQAPATQPVVEVSAGRTVAYASPPVDLSGMRLEELRHAAQKGDMYAQLMLGALYEDGSNGVTQDYAEAMRWYLKAARQDYPKAQHNLALMYEDGLGIPQDYRQAAIWYKKAANAGFSEAQNNLAVLYILGKGVNTDRQYAEQLLRQSVKQGNANAKRNLDMLISGAG